MVPAQVPSLVTCVTLRDEVTMLAELLAPIANPQLAATFRRALLDIFLAATQVRPGNIVCSRPPKLTVG